MKPGDGQKIYFFSLHRVQQLVPFVPALLCAIFAVGAYLQALDYPFIFDDEYYITKNAKLAELHLTELWRLVVEPYNPFSEFLPLRDISYWLDITLFGQNPSTFRMHNILLYLLCLPLVYATTSGVWRYFRPADSASAPWAAAAVTALFALHPALVESVVWISGRKYVLPNLFSMLAIWLAMHAKRERGLSAPYAAAALGAFVAVMLSKASYVGVAPLIAMLWVLFWLDIPKPSRHRSMLLWPLAILFLAGLLVLIFITSSDETSKVAFYFGIKAATRSLAVLGWLVRLAVTPESRHFYYPMFEDSSLPAMVTLGCTVLVATVGGWVVLLRKRSLEGFAIVTFLLLCMPYLQLIPSAPPSFVQDRYLALAVWPVMLLLVALCWRLKPVPRITLLLIIALPWGFQTFERPRDWRSFEALVDTDLRAYPGYYVPAFQKITGIQLRRGLNRDAGETASRITDPETRNIMIDLIKADYAVRANAVDTGNPRNAMNFLENLALALKQPPVQIKWNAPMYYVWGACGEILGNQWESLVEHFPGDVVVRYNAGLWLLYIQEYKRAAVHLYVATESQRLPESVRGTAFYSLGLALINNGYTVKAETMLRAALEQSQPDLRAYCMLSQVYKQSGRLEEAARAEASCRSHAPSEKTMQ